MNRHCWKALVIAAGLLTAGFAHPADARAGLIADTWNAIFGPPGTPYFPGAYTSYYAPTYYATSYRNECCRPVRCVPLCQPCNPCPTACNPCVSGACDVGPATSGNGGSPQTFKKPGTGTTDDPPQPDSKFQPRDDSKKFQPTDKSKKTGNGTESKKAAFPTPADDGDGRDTAGKSATERKAFRVPTKDPKDDPPGPVIRQKKPVPAKAPVEKSVPEKKKQLPTLTLPKFDDKITWKPTLPRTRLIINARLRHPQLSRTIVDPNAGWQPVRNDNRVVRK